jgi:hypothetical protein
MTALKNIEELRLKMKQARESIIEEYKVAFAEGSQSVFEAHPLLLGFSWYQYTPYFNDGDPCTFRANLDGQEMKYLLTDFALDDDDFEGSGSEGYEIEDDTTDTYWVSGYALSTFHYDHETRTGEHRPYPGREQYAGITDAVSEFMGIFDEDYLEDAFEGNAKIRVYRDGRVETLDYEPGY